MNDFTMLIVAWQEYKYANPDLKSDGMCQNPRTIVGFLDWLAERSEFYSNQVCANNNQHE